ncbi:MAG: DNA helicase RecQ [Candidatus Omnitrophica bacterium]|nr:DNA helicase RecQ [Candidatus Omnitrophota bacterium]
MKNPTVLPPMKTKEIFQILKSIFGYDTFRPLQEECVLSVLDKKDTLLIMPTGGGKSLCYQIPALIFSGLTVVISPLISLMKDQVSQLKELGVEAEVINSTLSWDEYNANKRLVQSGKTKLLFVAPETLFKPDILEMLEQCHVDCITVDEAHCISEWGHDFRPDYRRIKDIRSQFPHTVFLAVTATATERVRHDIIANLTLNDPVKLTASFNRDNLFYEVIPKNRATDQTLDFLEKFKGQSGIIYCFSRKQVDNLTDDLNEYGFKALPYHAGLSSEVRNKNQELFIRDDVPIIVATIAFGMGINKPNVRFVIHYELPKNIESYYQETGRAGRDGLPSHCLLLFNPGDIAKIRYFIDQKPDKLQRRVALDHLNAMVDYAESRKCRRVPLITYFGENYTVEDCEQCDNCVNPEEPTVDLTVEAIKFLQCISETEEIFGAVHLINVLRGSQSEKVQNYNHHECHIFGQGSGLSLKQWQNLVRQFIQEKLIDKEKKYGVLSLNERSHDLLSGKRNFEGYSPPPDKIKSKARRVSRVTNYGNTLFEELRKKRKELADAKGVPPYVIFSDKSLVDMCQRLPQNKKEFIQVFGVGDQKLKKFGDTFLQIIKKYHNKSGVSR